MTRNNLICNITLILRLERGGSPMMRITKTKSMHRRNLWKQTIQQGTLTTGGCPEQFPQERPRYCQTYSWGKVCEKLLKTNVPPFSSDGRQLFSFRLANVREDEQLSVLEPTLPKDGHQVRVSDMSSDQTGQDLALRPHQVCYQVHTVSLSYLPFCYTYLRHELCLQIQKKESRYSRTSILTGFLHGTQNQRLQ